MAAVGFLRSLWEKPNWEDVWPYLDPMDSVCLRTASVEWNVPGKYGPHSELLFFLTQNLPLLEGLGVCEGGVKLSHGPGHAMPGIA